MASAAASYDSWYPAYTWGHSRYRATLDQWETDRYHLDDPPGFFSIMKQRKRMIGGWSRECCLSIAVLIGFLIVMGAIIGAAVGAGLIVDTRTTQPTTPTTTTPTPWMCNFSCLNQSWLSSADLLAEWSFDSTFGDQTNNFNTTPYNNPSFITNGYLRQALSFNAANNQSLYTSYIPIANSSFTVHLWLYPTGYPNIKDHSILGLCVSRSTSMCLHLTIRNQSSNYNLYMGFMNNDCSSPQTIALNRWIHAAFVFDATNLTQQIYINGVLSRRNTALSPIIPGNTNVTIGIIPVLAGNTEMNVFQGYMDQLTISRRAKSACEILEEATLAARFPFDSGTTLLDYGPNAVTTTASSYSLLSSGHSLQAMSFTGTTSSYFQASGFTGFSINNQAFSFSLWVRPQSRSGSLVHLSTSSNGVGTWCTSLLGFASNGSLVAQTHNGAMLSVQTATLLPLSSSWTHVVQTWSSTNGLRLYVNNTLVASRSSATSFLATGIVPNYVTLANALTAPGTCLAGAINMGPFQGAIDDFSIYFRELTSADVCALYNT